jgi:O-antigen/teichoic acid export membrane protein
MFTRFGKDVGFYTLTAVIPAVFGFLGLVIFTRVFDAVAYGRYSLVLVFVTVSATATFGWLEQAILRFETNNKNIINTVLAMLVLLSLGIGAVASIGSIVGSSMLGPFQSFYAPAVAAVVGTGCFQVCRAIFQARLESKRVTFYATIRAVLKLGIGIGLSIFILDSIVGWLWGAAIGGLISVFMMIGRLSTWQFKFDRSIARRLARYGIPMIGWLFGMTLLTFIDRVLIELLAGTAAVGVYSSNYALVHTGLPLVLSPLIQAAHPAIMAEWSGTNHEIIRDLLTEYSRYFLLLGVGATVFSGIISRPLSVLVLGEDFHPGYVVIPIVATALFLWNFAMIGHKGLELYEWTGTMTGGIAVAVVINVGGNYVLIPPYGYVGAAVATLLSSGAYVLFAYGASFRTVRWRLPKRTVLHVAGAALLMIGIGAVGYQFGTAPLVGPILAGGIGATVYAGTLLAVGEFEPDELLNTLEMVHERG